MDIILAAAAIAVQAVTGFLAFWVSLKQKERKHWAPWFLFLTFLGIALGVWLAVRAKQSGDSARRTALGDAERPPYVAVISLPGATRFIVTNDSDYPAYGIRIRLEDDTKGRSPKIVKDFNYAELSAHSGLLDDDVWSDQGDTIQHHFTASIACRAGVFYEELILRPDYNMQWGTAARVMQGMRQLEQQIDSAWPRNAKGDIDWGQ